MRHTALALAALLTLSAPASPPAIVAEDGFDAPAVILGTAETGGIPLTVMTYNVHGLPWPLIHDRKAELVAIGERLAAMRRAGTAPHVVVLQEAFSDDARAIAARAGYAHVAEGPDVAEPSPFTEPPPATRYRLRGEGLGAHMSSGLVLMSDYPVVRSWRVAFPRTACAGYDCLANKGVMLARIAVPGLKLPVEIATTHLNSLLATRTPAAHANAAYLRQLAAADRFIVRYSDPRLPLIVAADLNTRGDSVRVAGLEASRARWLASRGDHHAGVVLALCGKPNTACRVGLGFGAVQPRKRNNDWQIFAGGHAVDVRAQQVALRFQPDPAGRTLSDHQALTVAYRLHAKQVPGDAQSPFENARKSAF